MDRKEYTDSLKASVSESDALERFKENEYLKYARLYNDKKIQEYFHLMVSSILMTHHRHYEDYTVEAPYRFKSPDSTRAKVDDYASSASLQYDSNGNPHFQIKEIRDAFAMKLIAYSRPPFTYSSTPELKELVDEKGENLQLLKHMQEFQSRLVEDEFAKPRKYKYECTRYEYYQNCKLLLERILTMIDPKATALREHYLKQLSDVNNCISFIVAAKDEQALIDSKDLTNKQISFFAILDDFISRIYDKLDLAILTRQFTSLFTSNPIFDKLGISLLPEIKEKRTENGFVANFTFIKTPFGIIECQLQSKHEYEEGNYGYAAHTKLTGKAIHPLEIPDTSDKLKIREFVHRIREIAPKSFLARIDSTEQNRVIVQAFSDYQNYRNLISQVAKGDPCERYLLNYFARLYAIHNKIFKSKGEESMGFIEADIRNYINGSTLAQIRRQYGSEYTL